MNAVPLVFRPASPRFSVVEGEGPRLRSGFVTILRIAFWCVGLALAATQAWIFRYEVTADSISYLDISDAVLPGGHWHRLINGIWSPLYPFFIGIFRRIFSVSPSHEIAAVHLPNVAFFIFAFLCFEYLLVSLVNTATVAALNEKAPFLLATYLSIAYALFLWASITQITLGYLRPDMLMSGFIYLSMGLLCRMRSRPANWKKYAALGLVLGVGYLAKAPVLPLGLLILAMSLFLVTDWRPALKMVAGAAGVMLLIGSLYFVPLSLEVGHFTLGESGPFNYAMHVDGITPAWYFQNPGFARGRFLHNPEKIFSNPPAYAFAVPDRVTHPLRFDPSYWTTGLQPHFAFEAQLQALKRNLSILKDSFYDLRIVAAVFVLAVVWIGWRRTLIALAEMWPILMIGLAGCAMYLVVSVEPRYMGAFLILICLGLLFDLPLQSQHAAKVALFVAAVVVVVMLGPIVSEIHSSYKHNLESNEDAQAAQALQSYGVKRGDLVARISPFVTDLGVERILRVEVVAEVDHRHASEFWSMSRDAQRDLLRDFVAQGAKFVIATSPKPVPGMGSQWTELGVTPYWVWRPTSVAVLATQNR